MRKIVSVKEVEKRNQKNQIIVGVILASLMLFSILGYAFQGRDTSSTGSKNNSTDGSFTYNGFEFVYQNGFWAADYLDSFLLFSYAPSEGQILGVESINKTLEEYSNQSVYIYSQDSAAESELKMNLLAITKDIQKTCIQDENCEDASLPVKNCSANSAGENIVIIKESSEQKVSLMNNCIIISGKRESLIRLTDEFLFKLFKIKSN